MVGAFRDEIREARQTLHEYMSVYAAYFKAPFEEGVTPVQTITVRVHDKFLALGDLKGTNFNYAEIEAISPKAIFMLEEVTPDRGYIISLEPGVAYRIDHTHEPDDISQKADIIKLAADKTIGFPLPSPGGP